MNEKNKATLTLVIITPFLTELLSGNMPPRVFFVNLPVLIFAYSLPVLLFRELVARWRLGLGGILSLGMAYGILNEGIWAKTLLLAKDVPINAFDHYGFFLGINFSWAAVILTWHAFHSVLFPILITHYWYPQAKSQQWLGKRTIILAIIPSVIFAVLTFFKIKAGLGTWPYLLIFSLAMLAFVLSARFMPKVSEREVGRFSSKPLLLGISVLIFYIISFALAGLKVPLILFFLYLTGIFLIFAFILKTKGWLVMPAFLIFAFGDYMAFSVFSGFSMLSRGNMEGVFSSAIFLVIFMASLFKIKIKINSTAF